MSKALVSSSVRLCIFCAYIFCLPVAAEEPADPSVGSTEEADSMDHYFAFDFDQLDSDTVEEAANKSCDVLEAQALNFEVFDWGYFHFEKIGSCTLSDQAVDAIREMFSVPILEFSDLEKMAYDAFLNAVGEGRMTDTEHAFRKSLRQGASRPNITSDI